MTNKAQQPRRSGFRRETGLTPRQEGTRSQNRSMVVVTNGHTEEIYFESLCQEKWVTARKVTVKYKNGAPVAAVLRAAKIRDEEDLDEAWAVCDVDEFSIKEAIEAAAKRHVELALSMPCFEIWLIFHLSAGCPRFNDGKQAGRHLKKLLPGWDKNNLEFADFKAGVFDAVARASGRGAPPDANPSTAIWRLIESLRSPPESA
jgi:hypothetical protein